MFSRLVSQTRPVNRSAWKSIPLESQRGLSGRTGLAQLSNHSTDILTNVRLQPTWNKSEAHAEPSGKLPARFANDSTESET